MSDTSTDITPQWAVIELMGHVRYGGLVSKDTQFGTPLLLVQVPVEQGFVSQFVNPSSLYRMTLCSEAIARAAAASGQHQPLHSWELPDPGEPASLPAPPARPPFPGHEDHTFPYHDGDHLADRH